MDLVIVDHQRVPIAAAVRLDNDRAKSHFAGRGHVQTCDRVNAELVVANITLHFRAAISSVSEEGVGLLGVLKKVAVDVKGHRAGTNEIEVTAARGDDVGGGVAV